MYEIFSLSIQFDFEKVEINSKEFQRKLNEKKICRIKMTHVVSDVKN